jgi:hypothetical protein
VEKNMVKPIKNTTPEAYTGHGTDTGPYIYAQKPLESTTLSVTAWYNTTVKTTKAIADATIIKMLAFLIIFF